MAIAVGILDKLGLRPGSRFGRAVMIGIPIAALIGGVGTPAGSSINLLGLVMIEQAGGDRVPFLHWMAIGIPMVAILLPVAAWVLLRFFPPEIASIGDLEEIHDERRRMGPVSRAEWKVVAIMSAMITLWIASTWLPVFDTFLVAVVGAVAMFLPGIGLFTWKEVQQVTGWDTLMVIGGVTSLGQASSQTGLATWLAESALGGLADWNAVALIAAISAFTVVIHLMLPIAPVINAVMIPPIMVLGAAAGVNPALYALPVIFTASCAFLLPLDAVPLVTYSRGYYRMFDMLPAGLVISAVWVVLMTVPPDRQSYRAHLTTRARPPCRCLQVLRYRKYQTARPPSPEPPSRSQSPSAREDSAANPPRERGRQRETLDTRTVEQLKGDDRVRLRELAHHRLGHP